jgi:hypothetical protein
MADEIAQQLRETAAETGIAALDPRVMAALRGVARERFVPPAAATCTPAAAMAMAAGRRRLPLTRSS